MLNSRTLFSTICRPICLFPGGARRLVIAAVGIISFQTSLLPQAAVTARSSFEVASVKPSKTNEPRYYGFHIGDDRFLGTNISVKDWIQIAWGVTDREMSGGPQWISSENFDIDAKAERPVRSVGEGFQMLQSLLEDRFSLKIHRETKEALMYSLAVGKNGLKMKPSLDQTGYVGDFPGGAPDGRVLTAGGPREFRPGRIAGEALPMSMIASMLTGLAGSRVVNKTGLMGRYDVDLRYTADSGQALGATPEEPTDSPDEESLFGALQTQLGLKLKSTRGPIEMLIVDHIERSSAN
jgi:uncharacterized protein (TIGR03435 family)